MIVSEQLQNQNNELGKPVAMANQPRPFHALDDRRFEQLVASVIDLKINSTGFDSYDSATLMNGISDKGRDIALYRDAQQEGIIQCKKYGKSINPTIFGRDLVKYILNSLLDTTLMPDPSKFTYYMAASGGFTVDCLDLIDQKRFDRQQIVDWVKYNRQKYTSLEVLNESKELYEKVWNICHSIAFKKITPLHLDNYLAEPACHPLIADYFAVQVVYQQSVISEMTGAQIKEQLRKAAMELSSEINRFDEVEDSHIVRSETGELFDWVNGPLEFDMEQNVLNITLLVGEAGFGKTIVLKDLLDQLFSSNIPVLAIKADKLYARDINALQAETGLSLPVLEFIEKCKQQFPKLVILIDQVDALSRSMSGDRSYINTLKKLVDAYTHDENVRIVISIRAFDMDYDPSLRIYKHIKSITLRLLSDDDVEGILAKLGINRPAVSEKLFQLLKVANNLNIFCRLVKGGQVDYTTQSLHDLHAALWKQKVVDIDGNLPITSMGLKKVIYEITDRIYTQQRPSLNEMSFEDYHKELTYLESHGIIRKNGQRISFFHQTFFDFLFAKKFVEQEVSVTGFLKSNNQSIYIRGALKMILDYLRFYDPDGHLDSLSILLTDPDCLFHIKHLCISLLAATERPTVGEMNLVIKTIRHSKDLQLVFIEKAQSHAWFKMLVEEGFLDFLKVETGVYDIGKHEDATVARFKKYKLDITLALLSRYLIQGDTLAWDFAFKLRDGYVLYNILYSLKNWADNRAVTLFDSASDFRKTDELGYISVLEQMAGTNTEASFKRGLKLFSTVTTGTELNYVECLLLEKWGEVIPEKLINLLFDKVSAQFKESNIFEELIFDELTFGNTDLVENEPEEGKDFLFQLLGICLRQAAHKQAPEFKSFLQSHIHSVNESVLRLLIFALQTNVIVYKDAIFQLFCHLNAKQYLRSDNDMNAQFRLLIKEASLYFSDEQAVVVRDILKNLVVPSELMIAGHSSHKRRISSYWGHAKYAHLLKLPVTMIQGDAQLWRQFQELQRRYPNYVDKIQHKKVIAHIVQSPLKKNAYKRMTNEQWVRSFLTYNKEDGGWKGGIPIGGLVEHSRAFTAIVKEGPSKEKVALIRDITSNTQVDRIYPVAGLSGLTEAKVNHRLVSELFIQLLQTEGYEPHLPALIRVARYLVMAENVSEQVVRFLVDCSKSKREPSLRRDHSDKKTSNQGLIMQGLNSIPGAAANALTYVMDRSYASLVFDTLDEIWASSSAATKAVALWQYAYLLSLDNAMAIEFFTRVLALEDDIYILASSLNAMQYMVNNDWKGCVPILEKLSASADIGKEDSNGLFIVLYFSFLKNRPHAERLLFQFLDNNPGVKIHASSIIFQYFYKIEDTVEGALRVLNYLLDVYLKMGENLRLSFSKMDHIRLPDIFDFLNSYIGSLTFQISEDLISYLTGQCKDYPKEAFRLFTKTFEWATFHSDDYKYGRVYDEITTFIITAYNALKEKDTESEKIKLKLLQEFDKLLLNIDMRRRAEGILEKSDFTELK